MNLLVANSFFFSRKPVRWFSSGNSSKNGSVFYEENSLTHIYVTMLTQSECRESLSSPYYSKQARGSMYAQIYVIDSLRLIPLSLEYTELSAKPEISIAWQMKL